jgi:serine/threonine-protein kinase
VFRAKVYGVAGFERQFAIKRFHTVLVAEPDRAAQLAHAARLYGALEHPRIARMHEFGVAGGETFTATELVRGVDLAQLVDATFGTGRPLPAGAAIALLSAAARAVGFAHGRGLAHLGLCPTNVLCTAEGDVKVTDFGFLPLRLPARPAGDASLLARLPYLAPEQHRGESGTPATDVFQLGLLAHELLRGEPALTGGGAAEIEKRALAGEPPALNVPKALGHVIRRALARSPYERFPDAGAMADALDAAVRATPLPGDRRDLAGLVRGALDQQAQMHENQMSGALRLPVPAPPRAEAAAMVAPAAPPVAPTSPAPGTLPVQAARPDAITRRPTPVPVARAAAATPPPIPRKTPPPIPAQPAPADAPEPVAERPSGKVTTEMGALPRPVMPPLSITGRIPKIASAGGSGAVPPPPDSGPGRSGLGSGRAGNASSPPAVPAPAAGAPRRPTPVPAQPRAPQTRPRVATPPPVEPLARRADTTSSDTNVATEPGADSTTLTRSAVPVKLTDTQPGTGPTTMPAARAEPLPDDPFSGGEHESDPDIFAGLFDESSGENAMVASQMPPRNERPTAGPPPATAPLSPTVSSMWVPPDEPAASEGEEDLPSPTQEMEADEPPLLRTLVGHVPITGATNGVRPTTASPTRSSNIIPRKRDQPASDRRDDPTDDDGGVTVPRRTASVRRVIEPVTPAPEGEAFERREDLRSPIPGVSSNILAAAAHAADLGVAQPVARGAQITGAERPGAPPGPESVEMEIVRPHLDPQLGVDPGPLPGAATMPDMGYAPQMPMYQPPAPMRAGGNYRAAKMLLVVLLLAGMGAGGYFGYMQLVARDAEEDTPAAGEPVAARAAPEQHQPVAATADGGPRAIPAAKTADAGPATAPAADLTITSTPPDAKVYLDGAPVGVTPIHIDGTGDRHKLALVLPGYKLHTAEIDGRGSVAVELEEVTPSSGPAGIKVKCKEKNRYYVVVDGVDTGQLCPTERIGTEMGPHNVEVYDPVTDARKAFPINIIQTRLSHRVKVDY